MHFLAQTCPAASSKPSAAPGTLRRGLTGVAAVVEQRPLLVPIAVHEVGDEGAWTVEPGARLVLARPLDQRVHDVLEVLHRAGSATLCSCSFGEELSTATQARQCRAQPTIDTTDRAVQGPEAETMPGFRQERAHLNVRVLEVGEVQPDLRRCVGRWSIVEVELGMLCTQNEMRGAAQVAWVNLLMHVPCTPQETLAQRLGLGRGLGLGLGSGVGLKLRSAQPSGSGSGSGLGSGQGPGVPLQTGVGCVPGWRTPWGTSLSAESGGG